MKRERRQPTPREWAAITSSRPVVRKVMDLPQRRGVPIRVRRNDMGPDPR